MKIKPRGKWLLVKPNQHKKETDQGLIVPDSVEKEKKSIGTIIEVGSEIKDLKKGQKVLFGKFAGEEVQVESGEFQKDQVDFVLLLSDDIMATIE